MRSGAALESPEQQSSAPDRYRYVDIQYSTSTVSARASVDRPLCEGGSAPRRGRCRYLRDAGHRHRHRHRQSFARKERVSCFEARGSRSTTWQKSALRTALRGPYRRTIARAVSACCINRNTSPRLNFSNRWLISNIPGTPTGGAYRRPTVSAATCKVAHSLGANGYCVKSVDCEHLRQGHLRQVQGRLRRLRERENHGWRLRRRHQGRRLLGLRIGNVLGCQGDRVHCAQGLHEGAVHQPAAACTEPTVCAKDEVAKTISTTATDTVCVVVCEQGGTAKPDLTPQGYRCSGTDS